MCEGVMEVCGGDGGSEEVCGMRGVMVEWRMERCGGKCVG